MYGIVMLMSLSLYWEHGLDHNYQLISTNLIGFSINYSRKMKDLLTIQLAAQGVIVYSLNKNIIEKEYPKIVLESVYTIKHNSRLH